VGVLCALATATASAEAASSARQALSDGAAHTASSSSSSSLSRDILAPQRAMLRQAFLKLNEPVPAEL
jgi:hypothetical protein